MPPDKYEDEIREILNKMDDFVAEGEERPKPKPRPQAPPVWSGWTKRFRRQIYTFSSTSFMAGTVIFALAAGLLQRIYPPFGGIAAVLAVGCLLMAIFLPMVSRRYGMPEKRWRGKVIDYEPYRIKRSGGSSWQYFVYRLKKFFRLR